MPRRRLPSTACLGAAAFAALSVALTAPAQAQTGGASPDASAPVPATAPARGPTGGSSYRHGPWLVARRFTVSPTSIVSGAALTIRYRVDGPPRRMRARVDLVPEAGGRPAARLRLGRRPTGRSLAARWRPELAPGRYVARLRATAVGRRRTARASGVSAVEIVAPPVTTSTGVFPVQGPYTLGGGEAGFGAERSGHTHQGHDIFAAEGTPVVAPRAGVVHWRAFQAAGAGHYIVVRADDGRDYVFMHLQDGSTTVEQGSAVAAGQQLGAVGDTGRADGFHLHFEIWPAGWYAPGGSTPIDPLPDLLSWAGAAAPAR